MSAVNEDAVELARNMVEMARILYKPSELDSERICMIQELERFIATGSSHPETFVELEKFTPDQPFKPLQKLEQFDEFTVDKRSMYPKEPSPVKNIAFDLTNDVKLPSSKQKLNNREKQPHIKRSAAKLGLVLGSKKKRGYVHYDCRVSCAICSAKLRKSHLKYHMFLIHGGPGQYKRRRGVAANEQSSIISVTRQENNFQLRTISCKYCGKVLHVTRYTDHLRQVHNSEGLKYRCSACKSRFLTSFACRKHISRRSSCTNFYSTLTSGHDRLIDNVNTLQSSSATPLTAPSASNRSCAPVSAPMTPAVNSSVGTTLAGPCRCDKCGMECRTPRGRLMHYIRRHTNRSGAAWHSASKSH